MERNHEETEIIPLNVYANNFGIIDFMDETNFDQFIDLIREENEANPIVNFTTQGYEHHQHSNNILDDDQGHLFSSTTPIDLFDFPVATNYIDHVINTSNCSVLDEFQDEVIMDGNESSGTTTTTNTSTKKKNNKVDRSRTLVSERKRRGRMKEKLYALRSLVPNITKMDKASIVGDAVIYVQDLQMRAKKLKVEIAGIESSLKGDNKYKGRSTQSSNTIMNDRSSYFITKKIYKMDVIQLEEKGFYVRIVSNKEKGVAVFLYKALESLTNINVRSSNLAASAENYVFTFTLHQIIDQEMNLSLQNMKLWIAGVFHNLGFDFEESP